MRIRRTWEQTSEATTNSDSALQCCTKINGGPTNGERVLQFRTIATLFFWLEDLINSRELTVVDNPTEDMIANLLTKLRRLLSWEQ